MEKRGTVSSILKHLITSKNFISGVMLIAIFLIPNGAFGYDTSAVTLQHRLFGILLGVASICLSFWYMVSEEDE